LEVEMMADTAVALDIPDPNKPGPDWKFQLYATWYGPPNSSELKDPAVKTKFLKERMSRYCEPYRTAFSIIDEDTIVPLYPGQQWAPTMKWDNHSGRVTLAGDAGS
jgi:hypothetical protein